MLFFYPFPIHNPTIQIEPFSELLFLPMHFIENGLFDYASPIPPCHAAGSPEPFLHLHIVLPDRSAVHPSILSSIPLEED